jgi:hypothetical protein
MYTGFLNNLSYIELVGVKIIKNEKKMKNTFSFFLAKIQAKIKIKITPRNDF